ncbi:MAG: TIGR03016 family PEP-CTERM system-associated outer membrane protein [Methylovulum sp.]|nr:TIGR03016 family PEP-CTERM system-associated outer membrane protein [Methylovulum sp.]
MKTQAIMDMGCMGIDVIFVNKRVFDGFFLSIRCVSIVYLLSYHGQVYAFDVTIRPSVSTQEIYSDNINLSQSGNEEGAFVTEVSPSVSVNGRSARSTLNLNYKMQNLYNAGGNDAIKTANQLQYNSHNTFIPNRLFLDSHSSLSQQNINISRIANDNISGSGNSTNVSTFGMSPYWTPHFGNYANGNLRLNFDTVTTDAGSSSNNSSSSSLNTISDTVNLAEIIQLNSGIEFQRVKWSLSHNNTENYRLDGNNVKFQNSDAIVRTYLNTHFNVFVRGGYSKNSFQSATNTNKNGISYTFGGQWKPSQYYSIEVGGGNNSYVTVAISPMQRLNWVTTFRKNSIGLNSGETWQTALNYKTRQSTWSLTHDNDTTTVQELLLQQQIFTVQDSFGNAIIDPVTNEAVQRAINLPTLTDEVITRKNWNFSVSYNTGKSTIGANAYNEDRVFQLSGSNQKVRGINATWNWRFASRTSAYLRPGWQQTDGVATSLLAADSNNHRFDLAIGLNRSITNQLNGRLEFRHVNQVSGNNINTNDYLENRATASLFMRY